MASTLERLSLRTAIVGAVSAFLAGCGSAVFAIANAPAHFSSVRSHTNLAYGDLPRQKLDVYAPPGAKGLPVVVFWYGGAWTEGSKANYRFVGTALAENGLVAILPDYRLYPKVRFPAFVEDGARAVAWVERHAEEFGGDHTRIVLMGHSAGAHQAALLALAPSYLEHAGADPANIVGLVGMSGPYALVPDTPVLNTIFAAPYQPSDWQPVQFVSSRAPPVLLLHGLDDQRVSPMHARKLHDALAAQGVRVEMELYAGLDHTAPVAGFTVFERKRAPTLARAVQFIKSVAGQRGTP